MMSKNDYKILMVLFRNKCTTEFLSYTRKDLAEKTGLSLDKVRNTIQKFKKINYVNEGFLNHQAKTYYITEEGIKKIKEIVKEGDM